MGKSRDLGRGIVADKGIVEENRAVRQNAGRNQESWGARQLGPRNIAHCVLRRT